MVIKLGFFPISSYVVFIANVEFLLVLKCVILGFRLENCIQGQIILL